MEDNKDVVVENNGQEVEKETTQKTYTEQDIQNSFNAGVKKASTDWQKDEKYKEFLNWKKSNETETEKLQALQTSNEDLAKENALLKAQLEVNASDVKKEFSKFVVSEVMALTNETTDFEKALKEYKKTNPQYFGEVVIKKTQTSPNLTGGVAPQSTNDIMNNILRGARN